MTNEQLALRLIQEQDKNAQLKAALLQAIAILDRPNNKNACAIREYDELRAAVNS